MYSAITVIYAVIYNSHAPLILHILCCINKILYDKKIEYGVITTDHILASISRHGFC